LKPDDGINQVREEWKGKEINSFDEIIEGMKNFKG